MSTQKSVKKQVQKTAKGTPNLARSSQLKTWVFEANELIIGLDENKDYEALKEVWEDLVSLQENIKRKVMLFRQVDSKKEFNELFKTVR